jgi:multiple sugar transport system permease protein
MHANRTVLHTATYALLILAILVMCFPLAWMLSVSFRPNVEVTRIPPAWLPEIWTLEGYRKFFESARYTRVFFNSVFISVVVTLLSLVLGALAAYALARFRFLGQRSVLMFLIITQMFPLVLLCIP